MSDLHRWAGFQARMENKAIGHCPVCGHLTLFDKEGNCQSCPKVESEQVDSWEDWYHQ